MRDPDVQRRRRNLKESLPPGPPCVSHGRVRCVDCEMHRRACAGR